MPSDRDGPGVRTAGSLMEPPDAHNRRLVDNVHPAGWVNPSPPARYDLVVIGGGTGGLVTAAIAAALGARVALVERHLLGGDCLNVGCVPSKVMLRAAREWAARHPGPGRGTAAEGFAAGMEELRRIRADISAHDSAARFRDLGVDVFLGQARFVDAGRVEVGGASLRFRRAVVATGTRPAAPPVDGLDRVGFLTNETVFSLTELPPRLLVIGGGPIGCELAQAFARFGSRVTLVQRGDHLLTSDDPEAAAVVRASLERDGVEVVTGTTLLAVRPDGTAEARMGRDGRQRTIPFDRVLVAAGRVPNVEGLGLDAAGVEQDERGIRTDDRLRTSNPRVYAVGDITSRLRFTHAADAQARMVVQNALFYGRGRASGLVVPWCTYTDPELAHVGLTAVEAAARGGEVDTLTVPMSAVDRARLDGRTDGFLRLHLARGSDRILGATLVADHAGEIISQLTTAITLGIGLDRLGQTIFPYPTLAEVVRKAADARRRGRLTPTVKKAFELFFRVTR